ncbi:MAG: putative membrane protein YdjX (TVP38/TMEM64 family) [Myxococcota bacterium]
MIWLLNAEAMVVYQVTQNDAIPWVIAIVVTCGQFIGYTLLYLFAHQLLRRWAFVRRSMDKVDLKEPGWKTYAVFATGGLCGIPPLLALFALYGSAQRGHWPRLLAAAMPGRLVWYMVWGYAPDFFRETFGWFP